jgi:hypothetical protein
MTIRRRVPAQALALATAITLASLLALVPAAQIRAQASASGPSAVIEAMSKAPTRVSAASVQQHRGGDDQNVLEKALLTVGIAGAAGAIALIGYLIRKRIDFWPHRPQPDDLPSSEEQH